MLIDIKLYTFNNHSNQTNKIMELIHQDKHIFRGHSFLKKTYRLNNGKKWYIISFINGQASFAGDNSALISDKARNHIKRINHYNQ